jgi:hypothetical protein
MQHQRSIFIMIAGLILALSFIPAAETARAGRRRRAVDPVEEFEDEFGETDVPSRRRAQRGRDVGSDAGDAWDVEEFGEDDAEDDDAGKSAFDKVGEDDFEVSDGDVDDEGGRGEAVRRRGRRGRRSTASRKPAAPGADSEGDAFEEQQDIRVIRRRSFFFEQCALAAVGLYLLNWVLGKRSNASAARDFFAAHGAFFRAQFAAVGMRPRYPDAEPTDDAPTDPMVRLSANRFRLYCSGRRHCRGLIATLELVPRQDLLSRLRGLFQRQSDAVVVEVPMFEDKMPRFCLALCDRKRRAAVRELEDVRVLTGKPLSREALRSAGLPEKTLVFTDAAEAVPLVFGSEARATLARCAGMVQTIHLTSDAAPMLECDEPRLSPALLSFRFRMPGSARQTAQMKELLALVAALVDHVGGGGLRIPASAAARIAKRRRKVEERLAKIAAAERREQMEELRLEKRRKEREAYDSMTAKQKLRHDEKEEKRRLKQRKKKLRSKTRRA